jgi:predicted patatin/cPLA2 family phospholipase
VPFIHGAVEIEEAKYLDPTFVYGAGPYIEKIIDSESGAKITYISNLPRGYHKYRDSTISKFLSSRIFELVGRFYPAPLQEIFRRRKIFIKEITEYLEKEKKIDTIYPRALYLRSARDTNKDRIEKLFQEGIVAAKKFWASRSGAARFLPRSELRSASPPLPSQDWRKILAAGPKS